MKSFFHFLYAGAAPLLAGFICVLASGFATAMIYHNPVQERVCQAVENHLAKDKEIPIAVFHENIFLTIKAIDKGEVVKADALERENYTGKGQDDAKVVDYPDIQVIGSVAKDNISKGQLIFDKDLANKIKSKDPNELDKSVKDSEDNDFLFWCILLFSVTCFVTGCVSYGASQIWITWHAFKKNILWGIGTCTIPLVCLFFELRNWEFAKKPIKLQILAFALLGLALGSAMGVKAKMSNLENDLAVSDIVFYVTKNIVEGQTIASSDLDEERLPLSKIPQDVITSRKQAVGHKSLYGISKGQIVSKHDLQ